MHYEKNLVCHSHQTLSAMQGLIACNISTHAGNSLVTLAKIIHLENTFLEGQRSVMSSLDLMVFTNIYVAHNLCQYKNFILLSKNQNDILIVFGDIIV